MTETPPDVRTAYSVGSTAWSQGPERIYARLAEECVARIPVALSGTVAVDVGAGTGVGSQALARAGATVFAFDFAAGMLHHEKATRPPAALADARRLPLPDAGVDVVGAFFAFNHLPDPDAGLREAARVARPGGAIMASTYAEDDTHPVRDAAEQALIRRGWKAPEALLECRRGASRFATVEQCAAAASAAGLPRASVELLRVPYPELGAVDLAEWRLGMAQHAWFVASLDDRERQGLVEEIVSAIGDAPILTRSVRVITAMT